MNLILRHITIHAALRRARANHTAALEAAAEIKANRRRADAALLHARARRLYAAWLDPRNPGWQRQCKPANVLNIATPTREGDIQFPRIPQALAGMQLVQKGGAA